MKFTRLLKHVWKKVYFSVDLPKNREEEPSELKLQTALFEFFLPTTKRKGNLNQWLGAQSKEKIEGAKAILKAIFIVVADIVLFVPRLAANILKLVTETLPLMLRELAYAGFQSMLEGIKASEGFSRGLYQFAALLCWGATTLLSFLYFVGCLLTSPGRTISAIFETFTNEELGLSPVAGAVIGTFLAITFAIGQVSLLAGIALIALPAAVATIFEMSWPLKLIIGGVPLIDAVGGFVFNTNPDGDNLIPWDWDDIEDLGLHPDTNISIHPGEFMKIFSAPDASDNQNLLPPLIQDVPNANSTTASQ